MKRFFMDNNNSNNKQTSLKRQFIVFSVFLFSLIFIGGSIVFAVSVHQDLKTNTGIELVKAIEIERIKLEASVNGEIALALKMATSPLLIKHFLNPSDPDLKRTAFDEIEGYRQAFASGITFWASDIDKEFYFSEDSHYTVDIDDPDNYWYKMTLYETEKYNFNINYNPEIQRTMLWINATVFDVNSSSRLGIGKGLPIGLVGTGIDLTEFINSIYKHYPMGGSLFLFNEFGEITGAKDASLVADKKKISDVLGGIGERIFNLAKGLKNDEFIHNEIPGGVMALGDVPALDWYITAIQPVSFLDILNNRTTFLFLAMMAVIAGIFVVFFLFITGMLKPMNNMMKTLDHISVDWDLTQRLHLHRNDEIGALGKFFNTTFEKIRELILRIKKETFALNDTGKELGLQMTTTRKDIDEIHENIQQVGEQVITQSDKVNSAAGSMERIIKGIDDLNNHITVQAESVSQSSAAIEEMFANIQSVTQTLVKNTENINSLAQSSGRGRGNLQKVSTDIQEIAHESEGLLEINSVMNSIAAQTNLLSMNAAIEAAHAGEAGRGFAVVADEIRKLAENSGKQSKTISVVLKKIKTMIDTITKSTSIVMEGFDVIEKEVKTVSDQEAQIRHAMEEQGEGSRQILEAIGQLNSVTSLVRKSSSDMTEESRGVLSENIALKKITSEIAGNMNKMSNNAEEITKTFTRVQEITAENKGNIDALNHDISKFKAE